MKKRILSIDGGGIRGVFPAAFLSQLEENISVPIGKCFDLIVGTSTGGIIAIALALGMKASEILKFYEEQGPKIFAQTTSGKLGCVANLLCFYKRTLSAKGKYDSSRLQAELKAVFGKQKLGHAHTRLVIPAWSSRRQEVFIYKTAHHKRFAKDYKASVVDVAMGTAAAPIYFAPHTTAAGVELIDGGIWANNPVLIAAIEAISVLGWQANDIKIMSLGCLQSQTSFKGYESILDAQSENALGAAKLLTNDAVHRISPMVEELYAIDDIKSIKKLKEIAFIEARKHSNSFTQEFHLDQPAEKFIPEHTL